MEEVVGSNPTRSTKSFDAKLKVWRKLHSGLDVFGALKRPFGRSTA
jgi:hypothetical protein